MQFDLDIKGKFSEIFLHIREIIMCFDGVQEIKNAKQTSYRDSTGRAVCMMRSKDDMLVLAFAQGSKLQEKYPFLEGCGKIVRHMYFKDINEVDDNLLKEMFEETIVLNLEDVELKKLKKDL